MWFIIAGSSNGRTRDFGSRYLGSNPGPAAKKDRLSSQYQTIPLPIWIRTNITK